MVSWLGPPATGPRRDRPRAVDRWCAAAPARPRVAGRRGARVRWRGRRPRLAAARMVAGREVRQGGSFDDPQRCAFHQRLDVLAVREVVALGLLGEYVDRAHEHQQAEGTAEAHDATQLVENTGLVGHGAQHPDRPGGLEGAVAEGQLLVLRPPRWADGTSVGPRRRRRASDPRGPERPRTPGPPARRDRPRPRLSRPAASPPAAASCGTTTATPRVCRCHGIPPGTAYSGPSASTVSAVQSGSVENSSSMGPSGRHLSPYPQLPRGQTVMPGTVTQAPAPCVLPRP